MNRAIPLLLLTAAVAGGLGYFAFVGPGALPAESGGQGEGAIVPNRTVSHGDQNANSSGSETATASLASIDENRSASVATQGGAPVREWEIIPMNQVGQPIPTATITATLGSQTKTAEGRVSWKQVPSGTWSLVVEAEGEPTWESEVTLAPDAREKTAVRMGNEIRVQGQVVDTNGRPLERVSLFFLPKGAQHPQEAIRAKRTPSNPKNPSAPRTKKATEAPIAGGIVTVQTSAAGRFRAVLPGPGEWRASVGAPGDARWTQKKGTSMKNGSPSELLLTVPALAELTMTFDGPPEERPSQLSVYTFDAELASRMIADRANREAGISDGGESDEQPMTREEAQIRAKKRALQGAAGDGPGGKAGLRGKGTARSSLEENRSIAETGFKEGGKGNITGADRPARQPLFDPGWRPLRSVPLVGEETVLHDLPGQEDLRFLFIRGRERIATASSSRLRDGERFVGVVTLPRPSLEASGISQSSLATVLVRTAKDDEAPKAEVGAVWNDRL